MEEKSSRYDTIVRMCGAFTNDSMCVFKACGTQHIIIITRKLPNTKTNESRHGIFDMNRAKFRADKLYVTKIINIEDLDEHVEEVFNRYRNAFSEEVCYHVDQITKSKNFDPNSEQYSFIFKQILFFNIMKTSKIRFYVTHW